MKNFDAWMKNRVKKHVPNAITCANLFSGCIGIVLAFKGELIGAAYAIFLSAIFDFFDGLASRVLKSFSGIGKDLDSLADVISFGFLPAAIMYQLFLMAPQIDKVSSWLNFIAFLIPVFSACAWQNLMWIPGRPKTLLACLRLQTLYWWHRSLSLSATITGFIPLYQTPTCLPPL
jgi:hypothetical protein